MQNVYCALGYTKQDKRKDILPHCSACLLSYIATHLHMQINARMTLSDKRFLKL